eukprot:7040252-Alexandrium_andersonii.AAC.1
MVITFYGFASDPPSGVCTRFEATSSLVEALFHEVAMWPDMPVIMCGDLNSEVHKIPPLRTAVLE